MNPSDVQYISHKHNKTITIQSKKLKNIFSRNKIKVTIPCPACCQELEHSFKSSVNKTFCRFVCGHVFHLVKIDDSVSESWYFVRDHDGAENILLEV